MKWFWSEQRAPHEQYEMLSFNVDPQWCGMLFSIYCQHEKGGSFITGPGQADAFAYSVAGPPIDTDLIAWAGSVSFEICSLSSTYDLIVTTAKSTGVLIFLGLSGFLCYKLLKVCWPCTHSKRRSSIPLDSPNKSIVSFNDDYVLDQVNVEYFGPKIVSSNSASSSPVDDSTSCGEDSRDADVSEISPIHLLPKRNISSSWRMSSPRSVTSSLHKSQVDGISMRLPRDESFDSLGFSKRIRRDGSFDSTCSELSLDFSLPEVPLDTITDLDKIQQEIDALKTNCLLIDEEFETIKCNRNFPGMSSLLKANSSRSQLNGTSNNANMDDTSESTKLERARACFTGLYSLTTVKNSASSDFSESIRYSIGSSDSLDWDSPKMATSPIKCGCTPFFPESGPGSLNKDESAVKFRLGNVTEDVEEGVSADVSEVEPSNEIGSENVAVTKEDAKVAVAKNVTPKRNLPRSISIGVSDDDLMDKLEWDETDAFEYSEDNMLQSVDSCDKIYKLGTGNNTPSRSWTASPCTERSSKMESSGFGSQMMDSLLSPATGTNDWEQGRSWNMSSEDLGFMEWDGIPTNQRSANCNDNWKQSQWADSETSSCLASEQSTPANENALSAISSANEVAPLQNIGPRIDLLQYAGKEWQGQTETSQIILQGYAAIPSFLNLEYMRQIRGDNYCAIRAALFQSLSQGFPIAPTGEIFRYLCTVMEQPDAKWLRNWSFANRLSYGVNVLRGMELCLQSLDNTVSLLSAVPTPERGERLAVLLNADPDLDLHLVEAVKLGMLRNAMILHSDNVNGGDVPIFAMLMFARDTSETPRDFMNNHLNGVGNTGGLEQVEMFLLGHTLGVDIQVVRPKSYATDDFFCCYSDNESASTPKVYLIAEDDRHYNVLVD